MARTLPEDDQDWSDVHRREESPERVGLPAWGWLGLAFVFAFYLRGPLARLLDGPALGTWTTIFVSISVQALPFLVLGVVLSGAITALIPPGSDGDTYLKMIRHNTATIVSNLSGA